ncbi:VCBS repeat-containing protein [Streptomyces sp. NPDC049555]|uniref:FG-GAP repeat domain-containing protein n=1 Tax=unclassified Streptomyces TaxID=2593676 RepID=UPI003442D928
MTRSPGRRHRRTLSRLVTAAIAAAVVGTTAGTATAAPGEARAESPHFPLMAAKSNGELYSYWPDGRGGFEDPKKETDNWRYITAVTQADLNQDGWRDSHYFRTLDGVLHLTVGGKTKEDVVHTRIGGGWNIYDRIFNPGNLAGAKEPDLLARDRDGVMWLYLAYPDGTLTDRVRVGGGWDQYTDIVGRGDLNDDGRTDVLAKDRNGNLWFYKGTGDKNDPFKSRVKVGGGWDIYNTLVATGDVDYDGRSDLLARDKSGVLWLYRGNGNETDPFANRTRIGGGWDQFVNLF